MKKFIVLLFFCASCFLVKANKSDAITTFNLTLSEGYGCVAYEQTYMNFHFEDNVFSITYIRGNGASQKEFLGREEFNRFMDSLGRFRVSELDEQYKVRRTTSASGIGRMLLEINGSLYKRFHYWTMPDDSTDFMFLHQWLHRYVKVATDEITLEKLLDAQLTNAMDFGVERVADIICYHVELDEVFTVLDTTKEDRITAVMLATMKCFKDERIIDYTGRRLLLGEEWKKSSLKYGAMMRKFVEEAFMVQDSCEKKQRYLWKLKNRENYR